MSHLVTPQWRQLFVYIVGQSEEKHGVTRINTVIGSRLLWLVVVMGKKLMSTRKLLLYFGSHDGH